MKRVNNLYEKISSKENIKRAIIKSSKGKTRRREVQRVLNNLEEYSSKIEKMLKDETYVPSPYKISVIYDNINKKHREISKPKYYPDQVIHYCLMNVLEPILLKKLYIYSCGCIPKKGTSYAQKHLRKWLDNDYRNTKYCLKMDISKFYPNINKELLKNKFKKIIKDKKTLNLINLIVDSNEEGIPIGNYTSGWFSNLFLNDLDTYIKETLKVKYYVRYVDDLVLLSGNKRKLHKFIKEIKMFLTAEKLKLKDNYQIFEINKRDIDFLGFRFFRDKTILRKRNMFRIAKRAKKIANKEKPTLKDAYCMVSYYGWIKNSNSYNYYHKYIKPFTPISKMKKIISDEMKKTN